MANFICEFEGVRGRNLKLYDTKIIITTKKTAGSLITGNFTDGEKTIYLCDVVGVQFKKSGLAIGYLQFETPSMQMNNKNDNFFSENTFTYEKGKNGITNLLMEKVYSYIVDRIEELKYNTTIITHIPDFESMKDHYDPLLDSANNYSNLTAKAPVTTKPVTNSPVIQIDMPLEIGYDADGYVDIICPKCREIVSFVQGEMSVSCPWCNAEINIK